MQGRGWVAGQYGIGDPSFYLNWAKLSFFYISFEGTPQPPEPSRKKVSHCIYEFRVSYPANAGERLSCPTIWASVTPVYSNWAIWSFFIFFIFSISFEETPQSTGPSLMKVNCCILLTFEHLCPPNTGESLSPPTVWALVITIIYKCGLGHMVFITFIWRNPKTTRTIKCEVSYPIYVRINVISPKIQHRGELEFPDSMSIEECDLCAKMLTVDPNRRISSGDIIRHPYVCHVPGASQK